MKYLLSTDWTCELCGDNANTSVSRTILSLPLFLFVILDMEYSELLTISECPETLKFRNSTFQLSAVIAKPASNHFNLLMKDPGPIYSVMKRDYWYLYDDQINGGDIIPLASNLQDTLKEHHAYILIFQDISRDT